MAPALSYGHGHHYAVSHRSGQEPVLRLPHLAWSGYVRRHPNVDCMIVYVYRLPCG